MSTRYARTLLDINQFSLTFRFELFGIITDFFVYLNLYILFVILFLLPLSYFALFLHRRRYLFAELSRLSLRMPILWSAIIPVVGMRFRRY
jgi:hypothetical protein